MAFCYPVTMISLLITLSILFQATPQEPLTGTERQLRELEDLLQSLT